MNVTLDFVGCSLDELKALLDGGTLTVYSVARPLTADKPVERSGTLATFTFASPAFGEASDGLESPIFAANPVPASSVGTPGFARARKADGTVIADFSAGPGDREDQIQRGFVLARRAREGDRLPVHRRGRMAGATGILRHPSAPGLPDAHDMMLNRRTDVSLATLSAF